MWSLKCSRFTFCVCLPLSSSPCGRCSALLLGSFCACPPLKCLSSHHSHAAVTHWVRSLLCLSPSSNSCDRCNGLRSRCGFDAWAAFFGRIISDWRGPSTIASQPLQSTIAGRTTQYESRFRFTIPNNTYGRPKLSIHFFFSKSVCGGDVRTRTVELLFRQKK